MEVLLIDEECDVNSRMREAVLGMSGVEYASSSTEDEWTALLESRSIHVRHLKNGAALKEALTTHHDLALINPRLDMRKWHAALLTVVQQGRRIRGESEKIFYPGMDEFTACLQDHFGIPSILYGNNPTRLRSEIGEVGCRIIEPAMLTRVLLDHVWQTPLLPLHAPCRREYQQISRERAEATRHEEAQRRTSYVPVMLQVERALPEHLRELLYGQRTTREALKNICCG